ncbi:MAG TPA: molybdenum cofactor guanylyltransferase [Pseudonocardiaceae bacterium]|nr:molybdenum cofactor guanylyltransferase [Pseudonocardiaceae bacterium]
MVLVGGRSLRMGTAKASLDWHGSTLLRRTLGVLDRAVDGPLLVVCAPGQVLPEIPAQVEIVEDPQEGLGPMQGIAAGLAALAGRAHAAFVCSTDLPFLHPAFIRRALTALTDDVDVVLPVVRGYPQPLAATYRISLATLAAEAVAAGELRPAFLYQRCATLRLDEAAMLADPLLAAADPALDSVVNVNSPDEYGAARRYLAPLVTVQRSGAGTTNQSELQTVRAATLSGVAAALGLSLDSDMAAELNGDKISLDGDVPLVSGDAITFNFADRAR